MSATQQRIIQDWITRNAELAARADRAFDWVSAVQDTWGGEMAVKGTDPFFPVDERKNDRGTTVQYANKGIAIRTEIAARVMAAIASDPAYEAGPDEAADTAVKWADALIARLNK